MSADFDPLKQSRINILHAGIELIAWDTSDKAFRLRNSFYQAIADINVDWVTQKTEYAIIRAQDLIRMSKERVS